MPEVVFGDGTNPAKVLPGANRSSMTQIYHDTAEAEKVES